MSEKESRLDRIGLRADSPQKNGWREADHQRYSRFLKGLKILLPLLALGIVVVLFSWNYFAQDPILQEYAHTKTTGHPPAQAIGKNELLAPHFDSTDEKGRPYTITADKAVQGADEHNIALEKPFADLVLDGGHWMALRAESGVYDQNRQYMVLKKGVIFHYDEGYVFETALLDIDFRNNVASTGDRVTGEGPSGILQANGMKLDTRASHFIFYGPAKLVVFTAGGGLF